MKNITLLMLTKNNEETIGDALLSVQELVSDIIIVDNGSLDSTLNIAKKYNARIITYKGKNLGEQRILGLKHVKTVWVLVLDADERLSGDLQNEIKNIFITKYQEPSTRNFPSAYYIPYQNHFLGKPLSHGGENYKMLRIFRKNSVSIEPNLVHEGFKILKGKVGELNGKIFHYSYRSLPQMFGKFHDYALRDAEQKFKKGEQSSLKKMIMYPIHMFYSRFIKDMGYKDGIYRIFLDLGFAYMEYITYLSLALKNLEAKHHL